MCYREDLVKHTKRKCPRMRRAAWLCAGLLAASVLGGCATLGINTRTLEQKPVVQAYDKLGSEAEETRSQAVGCPSCVY
jgi:hypothetical protein